MGSHTRGFFGATLHGIVMFLLVGSAFLLGCFLDFLKHPLEWITEYGFPAVLLVGGYVVALCDRRPKRVDFR